MCQDNLKDYQDLDELISCLETLDRDDTDKILSTKLKPILVKCNESTLHLQRLLVNKTFDRFISVILRKSLRVIDDVHEFISLCLKESVNVTSLESIFRYLNKRTSQDAIWKENSIALLKLLIDCSYRIDSMPYFYFPGDKASFITIPPINKWHNANGWTFNVWFSLDKSFPSNQLKQCPHLFSFMTKSNLGYSAKFVGSSIVLSALKSKGKGFQHCLNVEFKPSHWYMLTIVFKSSRWSKSEIIFYVNGSVVSQTSMNWQIETTEAFDKCFIGSSGNLTKDEAFHGKMSYFFCLFDVLTAFQINSLLKLGRNYNGYLKTEKESLCILNENQITSLYEWKSIPQSSLVFWYNPNHIDERLVLNLGYSINLFHDQNSMAPIMSVATGSVIPSDRRIIFHAFLQGELQVFSRSTLLSSIFKIGGIKRLFALYENIPTWEPADEKDETYGSLVFQLSLSLFRSSHIFRRHFVNSSSIIVLTTKLANSKLVNTSLLTLFIREIQYWINLLNRINVDRGSKNSLPLIGISSASQLVDQLVELSFLNSKLWTNSSVETQLLLYQFLSTTFVDNQIIQKPIQRVSAVVQSLVNLRDFYWNTKNLSQSDDDESFKIKDRNLNSAQVVQIRQNILFYIRQLLSSQDGVYSDELKAILNYLANVNGAENIRDVLQLLIVLMSEQQGNLVPIFDEMHGLQVIYKLMANLDEDIRIQAIRLLGTYLKHCNLKRKKASMDYYQLFPLIIERILLYSEELTVTIYNYLFEILVEKISMNNSDCEVIIPQTRFIIENPAMLKVITELIVQSKQTNNILILKEIFLEHIYVLIRENGQNRRSILQMPVWQEWLFKLCKFYFTSPNEAANEAELRCTTLVIQIVNKLLFHAYKSEVGGWRVWLDTIAICYNSMMDNLASARESHHSHAPTVTEGGVEDSTSDLGNPKNLSPDVNRNKDADCEQASFEENYRSFSWSYVHTLLLDNLLSAIEEDFGNLIKNHRKRTNQSPMNSYAMKPSEEELKQEHVDDNATDSSIEDEDLFKFNSDPDSKTIIAYLNEAKNQNYAKNMTHLILHLSDILVSSVGGILPLLALASNKKSEVEVLDSVDGISVVQGVEFILRLAHLADYVVFHSSVNLREIERERNLPMGGIIRQIFRLNAVTILRNCLEYSFRDDLPPRKIVQLFSQIDKGFLEMSVESFDEDLLKAPRPTDLAKPKELQLRIRNLSRMNLAEHLNRRKPVDRRNYKNQILSQKPFTDYLGAFSNPKRYLLFSLKPVLNKDNDDMIFAYEKAVIEPKAYSERLLEELDMMRLYNVIQLTDTSNKEANSLILSLVYYLSVLIVSKYREILCEHDLSEKTSIGKHEAESDEQPEPKGDRAIKEDKVESFNESTNGALVIEDNTQVPKVPIIDESEQSEQIESVPGNIQSIDVKFKISEKQIADKTDMPQMGLPSHQEIVENHPRKEDSMNLISKIHYWLGDSASFLQGILVDYAPIITKSLTGSHGQELISEAFEKIFKHEVRDDYSVEFVMLLCSQEWQTSLQKYAGLSFIQIINEGNTLNHSIKKHILRVAHEAKNIIIKTGQFINNRHAEFEQVTALNMARGREEDRICNRVVHQRQIENQQITDYLFLTTQRYEKLLSQENQDTLEFFKLDTLEDDSRRRRRFIINPSGSRHEADVYCPNTNARRESSLNESTRKKILNEVLKMSKKSDKTKEQETEISNSIDSEDQYLSENQLSESSAESMNNQKEAQNDPDTEKRNGTFNFGIYWRLHKNRSNKPLILNDLPIVYSVECMMITMGTRIHGLLTLTSHEIQFEMLREHPKNAQIHKDILSLVDHTSGSWDFSEIRAIFTRKYIHRNVALEIFMADKYAIFLVFSSKKIMTHVIELLPAVGVGIKYSLSQSRKSSTLTPMQIFKNSNITNKWRKREMSNFDYIMYLNTIAGRTYNDFNQYPIFPWILSNYSSHELNLTDANNYRDLTKPIGALNEERKKTFEERFNNWEDDTQPPFHYGTHYSTSAFVLSYLLRIEPFTTIFLQFQDQKFDHPDRTFSSIEKTWKNCLHNTSDVKELIPEFFYLPDMFVNKNRYDLGHTEDKERVDNVILPNWAKTPEEFIQIHRQALESEYVSLNLHHWIDLIFGYKQRGPSAVSATNVFCHLTYDDCLDFFKITDSVALEAFENQILCFGQTPSQLSTEPHPARSPFLLMSPSLKDEICMLMKLPSNSQITKINCLHTTSGIMYNQSSSQINVPDGNSPTVTLVAASQGSASSGQIIVFNSAHIYSINKWNNFIAAMIQKPMQKVDDSKTLGQSVSESPILPLSIDPALCFNQTYSKRYYGDSMAIGYTPNYYSVICSPDGKAIISCGYFDKSFRIFNSETCEINQIVYGHFDLVTCLARSESGGEGNSFFILTGSRDGLIMVWLYNIASHKVVSEFSDEPPTPITIIESHQSPIRAITMSVEIGFIVSSSDNGHCFIHSIRGDILHRIYLPLEVSQYSQLVDQILYTREGYIVLLIDGQFIALYSINGDLLSYDSVGHILGLTQTKSLQGPSNKTIPRINCIKITKCGTFLICGDSNGFAWIIRTLSMERVHIFPKCTSQIVSIDLTFDHRFIITGLESGCLVVYNVNFHRWQIDVVRQKPS